MHTDDMNDMVLMGMARDEAHRQLTESRAETERLQAEVSGLKLQLGMCDSSLIECWNDAIEAAAKLAQISINSGGMAKSMAHFVSADDWKTYMAACLKYADTIRALKK